MIHDPQCIHVSDYLAQIMALMYGDDLALSN